MPQEVIEVDKMLTRAVVVPSSYSEENNTIDVVVATETPVRMYNWREDRYINEVLEISENAIDFTRLNNGAPALNTHNNWDLDDVIGVVERSWIEGAELKATIKLSTAEKHKDIVKNIKDGIIRNISAGYRVTEYTVEEKEDSKVPTYRATKWQPMEVSFVPVPADPNSGTRSEYKKGEYQATIINNHTNTRQDMPQEQTPTPAVPTQTAPTPQVDEAAVRQAAAEAERTRVNEIISAVDAAKLERSFADAHIKDGTDIATVRAAIIDEMAKNANKPPVDARVTDNDNGQRKIDAVATAINARATGDYSALKDNEQARGYVNMSLLEIAKDCLADKGENVRMMNNIEVTKRAFATTDFPAMLTNATTRTLLKDYDYKVPEWSFLGRKESLSDYRAKTGLKLSGALSFDEIPETGEYQESKFLQDDDMNIQLKRFGRKIVISHEAIINDDLGVFSKIPQKIALASKVMQSKAVWNLITGNATSSDGVALFHASHNNLGTAGALSEATLSEARKKMRLQTDAAGELIFVQPTCLIVGPELETSAQKILSSILANQTSSVNVFAGSLKLIVCDWLGDSKAWYLSADPMSTSAEMIAYAYMNGNEGLSVDSRVNFNTDALEIKAGIDFAAKVWGHQGFFKNAGE